MRRHHPFYFCSTLMAGLILTAPTLWAQAPNQPPAEGRAAGERGTAAAERGPAAERGQGNRAGAEGLPAAGEQRGLPPIPVLVALDADRDGEISAQEIGNAAAALKRLDGDNNGKLTRDELVMRGSAAGAGAAAGAPGGPGNAAAGFGNAAGGLGNAAGGEAMVMQLVQRTLTMDQNGDGRLSRAEIPAQMQKVLALADLNRDGALDRLELMQMAQQRVAMMMRSGRAAQGAAAGYGQGGQAVPGDQAEQGGQLPRGEAPRAGRGNEAAEPAQDPRPAGDE